MSDHNNQPKTRDVPHDIHAEEAVLGGILYEPGVIVEIADRLEPEHFYVEQHRMLYAAMKALYEGRKPCDVTGVATELTRRGQLDAVPHSRLLALHLVPSLEYGSHHVKTIIEMAARRAGISAGGEIAADFYDLATPLDELQARAYAKVTTLPGTRKDGGLHSFEEMTVDFLDHIDRSQSDEEGIVGILTGLASFDNAFGGVQPGDMIVGAARPGCGKTSIFLQWGVSAAKQGRPGLVFSLEMPREQVMQRVVAAEARVDNHKIRIGRHLSDDDMGRITDVVGRISELPLLVDDSVRLTVADLATRALRAQVLHNIEFVVVDYLQLLRPASSRGNREQEVANVSRDLKGLAKQLSVPVLVAAQVGRSALEHKGAPRLSDLRESGAIEADADVVFFLYPEHGYGPPPDGAKAYEMNVEIAKFRNGATKDFSLMFEPHTTRFYEMAQDGSSPWNWKSGKKPSSAMLALYHGNDIQPR